LAQLCISSRHFGEFYFAHLTAKGILEVQVVQHHPTDVHRNIKNSDLNSEYESLYRDFTDLCDLGGRLLGTESERNAVAWVCRQFASMDGEATAHPLDVPVWRQIRSELRVVESGESLECQPMLRTVSTPPGGLLGKIIDMGKGRPEDYEGIGSTLRGHIAMVEHEYPFSPTHVHRREKIHLAIRHGAKAVLMSNPTGDGALLSGSSAALDGFDPIPCGYITHKGAERLRMRTTDQQEVLLILEGAEETVSTQIPSLLIGDPSLPRIVLSAHIDGHPLGESALDNATGVAVAIAAARRLAPLFSAHPKYALETFIFTAEEWGLYGSEKYLAQLPATELQKYRLNVNLDTVGGSSQFTALISGFPRIASLIQKASEATGIDVGTYLPLLANSDHYNFARAGVPAFRLVAGFDDATSKVQHILAGSDTRDKVKAGELERALEFVSTVIATAVLSPKLLDNLK